VVNLCFSNQLCFRHRVHCRHSNSTNTNYLLKTFFNLSSYTTYAYRVLAVSKVTHRTVASWEPTALAAR